MTFTFNTNIPAANNNPSVDQPDMLGNNVATDGIIAVDHISFNALNGGQHKQVTFNNKNVPGAQTDPQSVLYTNNVGATAFNTASASTVAEMFYINQSGTLPISLLKAYGYFDNNGNPLNTFNCSSGAFVAGIGYTITMPANIITGTDYGIVATANFPVTPYGVVIRTQILSATQFILLPSTPAISGGAVIQSSFTILVLQL